MDQHEDIECLQAEYHALREERSQGKEAFVWRWFGWRNGKSIVSRKHSLQRM